MRILLAEDEVALAKAVVKILEKNNFSADAVHNGEDALLYLCDGNYDLAVLDIMMPKMDGITVLKKARAAGVKIPIIMLTAKSEIEDRVLGLDSGADDYLPKPFDSRELLARIRAATRAKTEPNTKIAFGNITLDRATFELSSPTGSFRLANKEYQLMELFLTNPRVLFSAERLLEKIWGFDTDAEINVVWVYISYLRKKLQSLCADVEIRVFRGAGYALEDRHDS